VILLSPVTITTLIPAFLQSAIAPLDYYLGGSSIPKTPNNIKPLFSIYYITSFLSTLSDLDLLLKSLLLTLLYATETVRSPLPAIFYN
jgi:hypothetical protein